MAVALLITFKTSQPDHIVTQLRAYKEREFDRNPPRGFIQAQIQENAGDGSVLFRSEWQDEDALENTLDSAPFEACLDLCDIHADSRKDERVEI